MAANEYDELDRELGQISEGRISPGAGGGSGGLRILPIIIGVVSILALGSIIWYAYSQGVREGSEVAAPVLRPDSPAKVAPEDRGGREIAGTDLEVYERLSATEPETGSARVERILPPPEEPTLPAVVSEAAPPAAAPVGTVTGTAVLSEPPRAPAAPVAPAESTRPAIPTPTASVPAAPAPQASAPQPAPPEPALAAPTAPPPTAGQTTQAVAAAAAEQAQTAVITPPQPAVPPPPAAPEPTQTAAAPAAPAAPPASSAGSGWRIQLAAVKSDAAARAEWSRRQSASPQLLGSLALEVQQATVNGTEYFRVRGGPLADRGAAQSLCAQLKAANIACIPVAPGR